MDKIVVAWGLHDSILTLKVAHAKLIATTKNLKSVNEKYCTENQK